MKRQLPLEGLWIVAAWEHDPPCAPWRPLLPVFARDDAPDRILWPLSLRGISVEGHEEPAVSLEEAIAEGSATSIGARLRARPHHELVRRPDGTFAVLRQNEVVGRRLAEIRDRLARALQCFEDQAPLEDVQDAFDGAYLVHPVDPVTATLRAGAAARLREQDPGWWVECMGDLEHAVENGADLVVVRDRLPWNELPCASLRESLFRAAREALDDYLRPRTDLWPPVSREVQCAAFATALWRRRQGRVSTVRLPHALLTRVLAGDPDAMAEARPRLAADPTWLQLFNVSYSGAMLGGSGPATLDPDPAADPAAVAQAFAQAKLTDIDRFASTLHQLEQLEEGPARSACWRSFLQRTQGLERWKDTRPWRQGELAADELRSRLDLNGHPIGGMRPLAASNGIFVGVAALSDGPVDAAASLPRNVPPCMFVNDAPHEEGHLRGRFAMAHELCHLLLDRSRTGHNTWVCQTAARDRERAITLDMERRANAFAAYLLAPRDAVRKHLDDGPLPPLDTSDFVLKALSLREHFGLTATAAAEHLVNCHHEPGIEPGRERLSDEIRTRVRQACQKTPVKGFEADKEMDEEPLVPGATRMRRGRFAQLLRLWVAAGELPPERAASLLGVDPDGLSGWLPPAG